MGSVKRTLSKATHHAFKTLLEVAKTKTLNELLLEAGITSTPSSGNFAALHWRELVVLLIVGDKYSVTTRLPPASQIPQFLAAWKPRLTVEAYATLIQKCEHGVSSKRRTSLNEVSPEDAQAFYRSYPWRQLRFKILSRWNGTCMACRNDEGGLHVDHIKPLRRNWSRRFDPTNLQVLCAICNHGKGNWSETDFRPDWFRELFAPK